MSPKNIIIGQKYKNSQFPGTVYLGVGERKFIRDSDGKEMNTIGLVIIECEDSELVGHRFVSEDKMLWKKFSKIS